MDLILIPETRDVTVNPMSPNIATSSAKKIMILFLKHMVRLKVLKIKLLKQECKPHL